MEMRQYVFGCDPFRFAYNFPANCFSRETCLRRWKALCIRQFHFSTYHLIVFTTLIYNKQCLFCCYQNCNIQFITHSLSLLYAFLYYVLTISHSTNKVEIYAWNYSPLLLTFCWYCCCCCVYVFPFYRKPLYALQLEEKCQDNIHCNSISDEKWWNS